MMLSCWAANPDDRPSFTDLRNELERLLEEEEDELYISVDCEAFDEYCALMKGSSSSSENGEEDIPVNEEQLNAFISIWLNW